MAALLKVTHLIKAGSLLAQNTNLNLMELLNQITISDLSNYCRTCLQVCEGEGYEMDSLSAPLIQLLKLCVPYKKNQKTFPNLLCPLCYEVLRNFEEFRSTALQCTILLEQATKTNNPKRDPGYSTHYKPQKIDCQEFIKTSSPVSEEELENEVYDGESSKPCEVDEETDLVQEKPQKIDFQDFIKTSPPVSEEELENEVYDAESSKSTAMDEESDLVQEKLENVDCEEFISTISPGSEQSETKIRDTKSIIKSAVQDFEEIFVATENEFQVYNNELLVRLIDKPKRDKCVKKKANLTKKKCGPKESSENRPYKCSHCERCFRYTTTLSKHLTEVHNIEKTFAPCPQENCKKTFDHQETAAEHYRLTHDLEGKEHAYVCELCGSTFDNSARLQNHRYHHDPDARPFHCKICDKRFVLKSSYKEHQLRHAGIKTFECPYCEIKKTSARELRAHINFHTKEKEYPCPLCPRIFYWPNALKVHDRLVHKGIRRFNCRYCDQAFGKPETRKYHELRHTGEKPFPCEVCKKNFISPSNLLSHMKTKLHIQKAKGEVVENDEDSTKSTRKKK